MSSQHLSKTLSTTCLSALLIMATPSKAMMQPQEEEKKSAPAAPISTVQDPEGVVPTPISLTDLPPSTTTAVTISSLVKTTEGVTEVISGAVQAHPPYGGSHPINKQYTNESNRPAHRSHHDSGTPR